MTLKPADINFTPRAVRTLDFSVDEARRLNDDSVDPDHVLLGIVREGESIAVGVLESLGVNLNQVESIIMERRIQTPGMTALNRLRFLLGSDETNPVLKRNIHNLLVGLVGLIDQNSSGDSSLRSE